MRMLNTTLNLYYIKTLAYVTIYAIRCIQIHSKLKGKYLISCCGIHIPLAISYFTIYIFEFDFLDSIFVISYCYLSIYHTSLFLTFGQASFIVPITINKVILLSRTSQYNQELNFKSINIFFFNITLLIIKESPYSTQYNSKNEKKNILP